MMRLDADLSASVTLVMVKIRVVVNSSPHGNNCHRHPNDNPCQQVCAASVKNRQERPLKWATGNTLCERSVGSGAQFTFLACFSYYVLMCLCAYVLKYAYTHRTEVLFVRKVKRYTHTDTRLANSYCNFVPRQQSLNPASQCLQQSDARTLLH
jgi:hypothetical protein